MNSQQAWRVREEPTIDILVVLKEMAGEVGGSGAGREPDIDHLVRVVEPEVLVVRRLEKNGLSR
ncbi:hypothetical protein FQZ97_1099410 [compost metagenome]